MNEPIYQLMIWSLLAKLAEAHGQVEEIFRSSTRTHEMAMQVIELLQAERDMLRAEVERLSAAPTGAALERAWDDYQQRAVADDVPF